MIHYYEEERLELFNLAEDLSEENDRSMEFQDMANQLDNELMEILNSTGARFPKRDPLYTKSAEQTFLAKVEKERLPRLEKQRMKFLSEDFNPENNWWDSKKTLD